MKVVIPNGTSEQINPPSDVMAGKGPVLFLLQSSLWLSYHLGCILPSPCPSLSEQCRSGSYWVVL